METPFFPAQSRRGSGAHQTAILGIFRDRRMWFGCIAGFAAVYYALVTPYLGSNMSAVFLGTEQGASTVPA
jgi:hypothetical protein